MRKSILYFTAYLPVAATAFASSTQDNDVLEHAHRTLLEFRAGNSAVVQPLVKSSKRPSHNRATTPASGKCSGTPTCHCKARCTPGRPTFPPCTAVGERARDAYAHSLALDGNSALVRASHGMSQMVVSQLKGDGPGVVAGIDEMNAAVRQSPKSTGVRLTRAFTIVHLPPAMRDTNAVTEDLKFILDTAPGGRPEDVLHVLLGDVYAEMGDLKRRAREYEQVTGASAFAAEQVQARLAALPKGAIPAESIALVRMGIGTRCAMCHAPGTDN